MHRLGIIEVPDQSDVMVQRAPSLNRHYRNEAARVLYRIV
jgi:hypothetical protein